MIKTTNQYVISQLDYNQYRMLRVHPAWRLRALPQRRRAVGWVPSSTRHAREERHDSRPRAQQVHTHGESRSDPKIFNFITGLGILGTPRDLGAAVAEAKARKERVPEFVLVMSHARRLKINAHLNRLKAPTGAKRLKCKASGKELNEPQSMFVWPGLTVVGFSGRTKRGIFYEIESMDEDFATLRGDGVALRMTLESLVKNCRL